MTFNEYFTELQIDFDSYFNEFACESIMFELYADEYDNVDVATESLSLTFDDIDDEPSIAPAFEEAKRSFGDMLKAGFEKVLNFFKTIGNAIANFIRSLVKKKKTEDKTEYEVKDTGDAVEIRAASDSQTTNTPTLLLTQKPIKNEDSAPSKPPTSPSQTATQQTPKRDASKSQPKHESKVEKLNPEQQKPSNTTPAEQPKVDKTPKKAKRTYKLTKNAYNSLSKVVKETTAQVTIIYTDLIKSFEKLSNSEKALIQIFDQAMKIEINGKTVSNHLKNKDSEEYDTNRESDPKIEALKHKAYVLRKNADITRQRVSDNSAKLNKMLEKFVDIYEDNDENGNTITDHTSYSMPWQKVFDAIANINRVRSIKIEDVINRAKEMEKRCSEIRDLLTDCDLRDFVYKKKDVNGDDNMNNLRITACGKMLNYIGETASYIAGCCKTFINIMSRWTMLIH